eukprot:1152272-Pelagomonas_calceolata.AAC.20
MKLQYLKTILPPADGLQKVNSLTWTPNKEVSMGKRKCKRIAKLAAVTSERVVYLFDDNGEKRDKFRTKPADQGSNPNFVVRAMAFSPDSTRLAIAQSDNIVFVYRLGDSWTDKKSICNKFLQSSSVTCLIWPHTREDVVFGLADGKVKLGQEEGGSGMSSTQVVVHSAVPYALGWGQCIATAGNDNKQACSEECLHLEACEGIDSRHAPRSVSILWKSKGFVYCGRCRGNVVSASNCVRASHGRTLQTFDYSGDDGVREFTACAFNPSGDAVVFGTYNRFYVYVHNAIRNAWEQVGGLAELKEAEVLPLLVSPFLLMILGLLA